MTPLTTNSVMPHLKTIMWQKAKKILKYTLFIVLISIIPFLIFNWESAIYGFRQAKGQLTLIANTKPIEEVLNDKNFPDSLKKQILLIQEIKRFATDSLGLNPSENYTTFYDQHKKPLMFVIVGCEPFELKAKTWDFPIVGTFRYKGHFDEEIAKKELEELKKQGFDTRLGEASAWSTLGYLKDPILSSMLYRSEGQLADLIIHELTHGTLFVKNNLEFNENLADFVGDYGAIRFLESKYGKSSKQLEKYLFSRKYNEAYSQHLLKGVKKLDSLYVSFRENKSLKTETKKALKDTLIKQIMFSTDTLLGSKFKRDSIKKKNLSNNLPNNAYFIGYMTYQSKQNQFEEEFKKNFESDFKKYLRFLKEKYPNSKLNF